MAAFNKFQPFVANLAQGKIKLDINGNGGDTLKVYLSNEAPLATDGQKSDIAEITAKNGYTAGGNTATVSTSSQSSGTFKLVLADPTIWTATTATDGTGIGPFRYAILYSDTSTNDLLIGWWDYLSSVTLADTETFLVDFDAGTGVLTIA